MYIFNTSDGQLRMAPDGFTPDSFDPQTFPEDVVEVLAISKTFVKQVRLVVKPVGERKAIREKMADKAETAPVEKQKTRKRKK